MTKNQQTGANYMEGFRRNNHLHILTFLTDDVEWIVPGAFHVRGKEYSVAARKTKLELDTCPSA